MAVICEGQPDHLLRRRRHSILFETLNRLTRAGRLDRASQLSPLPSGAIVQPFFSDAVLYKNNRSKSACTLNARKRLNNQAVWPVIFDITGPICARALKTQIPFTLGSRGHHDWPVMSVNRTSGRSDRSTEFLRPKTLPHFCRVKTRVKQR